jgi:hypothetical protein
VKIKLKVPERFSGTARNNGIDAEKIGTGWNKTLMVTERNGMKSHYFAVLLR